MRSRLEGPTGDLIGILDTMYSQLLLACICEIRLSEAQCMVQDQNESAQIYFFMENLLAC